MSDDICPGSQLTVIKPWGRKQRIYSTWCHDCRTRVDVTAGKTVKHPSKEAPRE